MSIFDNLISLTIKTFPRTGKYLRGSFSSSGHIHGDGGTGSANCSGWCVHNKQFACNF